MQAQYEIGLKYLFFAQQTLDVQQLDWISDASKSIPRIETDYSETLSDDYVPTFYLARFDIPSTININRDPLTFSPIDDDPDNYLYED